MSTVYLSKTFLFQAIQFSQIALTQTIHFCMRIDRALLGATIPGQCGPGSNVKEGVLHIPQSCSITGNSPSDCLVSYPGHLLVWGSLQSCSRSILQPRQLGNIYIYIYIYIYISVCVCVCVSVGDFVCVCLYLSVCGHKFMCISLYVHLILCMYTWHSSRNSTVVTHGIKKIVIDFLFIYPCIHSFISLLNSWQILKSRGNLRGPASANSPPKVYCDDAHNLGWEICERGLKVHQMEMSIGIRAEPYLTKNTLSTLISMSLRFIWVVCKLKSVGKAYGKWQDSGEQSDSAGEERDRGGWRTRKENRKQNKEGDKLSVSAFMLMQLSIGQMVLSALAWGNKLYFRIRSGPKPEQTRLWP